jgi:PAS domain S-box-containing protein
MIQEFSLFSMRLKGLGGRSEVEPSEPEGAESRARSVSEAASNSRLRARWLAKFGFVALVLIVQYLAVRLGLVMGIAHGNVSPVWPATGIAIAFLLRFGVHLWPGVALGSFFALAQTGVGPFVAGGEAVAALLEALTAVWLIRGRISMNDAFCRVREVVSFCFLCGGIATALSATIGVASLFLGGLAQWHNLPYLWGTWWLGDMMGALIIAPFLIVWTMPGSLVLDRTTWSKTAIVLAIVVLAGFVAFWGPFVSSTGVGDYPIAFLTLPMVVSAAFLSGRRGATAACLLSSAMAISGTVQGLGPFFRGSVNESLLLLQSYLVVISVTGVLLAAVLKERDRALDELRRSQGELETRILERTEALSTANDRMQWEIAERKKVEEALRQSEQILSLALYGANLGIWDWDLITGKALWTEKTFQILGYAQDDFEPTMKNWKKLVHPDDWPQVSENLNLHIEGKISLFEVEYRILNKAGEWQWVRARGKVIDIDAKGKPTRMTGVFSDATEPKRAQEERRSLLSQLTQAQKMEAIGTLTGGIAHDFNNLLTVINGYTEMILWDRSENDPIYSDLWKILDTGRKGAELVQRLLAFSRKADIKLEPLDVNRIVENLIGLMERTFPKMIEIETTLEHDLGTVNADAVQLEQVLMNLCINAKEAMPEGGKLRFVTRSDHVDGDYCRLHPGTGPGRYVVIEITDTGFGMSKETVDRVFDPFFTTKGWDSRKGTGLGLSVAKGIAEQHGGWISCNSESGIGTTFRLYLPTIEAIPSAKQGAGPGEKPSKGGKILLVDDEKMVRDLGRRILERAGYEVITAADGMEALETYGREGTAIGLVVLDLIMPHMGGEKCLEELLKINPNIKAVISSGHSLSPEERHNVARQAKGFVDKPYQVKQFLEVVTATLGQD